MIPAFCCRGDSTAAEQAAIISEAQELGFEVCRKIDRGQTVLILNKKGLSGKPFTIIDRQSWESLKIAGLES